MFKIAGGIILAYLILALIPVVLELMTMRGFWIVIFDGIAAFFFLIAALINHGADVPAFIGMFFGTWAVVLYLRRPEARKPSPPQEYRRPY